MVVQYMARPIYQIVLGLNPLLFGIAMTIPRVWDAFTDPIMGSISDNFRSRYGRRRPFAFAGAILTGITFASIWLVPRNWGEHAMFAYLVGTSLLYFTATTIFSVPLTSLSYEMTPGYHERTRVMAASYLRSMSSKARTRKQWGSPPCKPPVRGLRFCLRMPAPCEAMPQRVNPSESLDACWPQSNATNCKARPPAIASV